jgi:UDP-N-acetylglucosamine diphosphorylase / glucose-1-phosphate thymidylyltransferase / UDP-N-acetylgalactosamine diphosphorylase / glucosamine-1-phosphate N-acetyltransferase / galactosamine-1-phosphate N-acetyltransferase
MVSFTESSATEDLYPLTLTRQVADVRVGILTIREKWQLAGLAAEQPVDPAIVPNNQFFQAVAAEGYASAANRDDLCFRLHYPWEIPSLNAKAISEDLEIMVSGMERMELPSQVQVTGDPGSVFAENGAVLEHCFINVTGGPVHIAAGATIMEGAMLRGPVSIGKGAMVKMGAAIYSSTIGPNCVVGGEIRNSVFLANSNKAHEGYIGDAVIGEWCNLGAGTSCSNIRNTGSEVSVWHMKSHTYRKAGLKCGLIMGDHSRCSINTSFNTGTVVGVSAHIFQPGGLTPKFIPSFSWGMDGTIRYRLPKAIEDIRNWMAFRHAAPDDELISTLTEIYNNHQ